MDDNRRVLRDHQSAGSTIVSSQPEQQFKSLPSQVKFMQCSQYQEEINPVQDNHHQMGYSTTWT